MRYKHVHVPMANTVGTVFIFGNNLKKKTQSHTYNSVPVSAGLRPSTYRNRFSYLGTMSGTRPCNQATVAWPRRVFDFRVKIAKHTRKNRRGRRRNVESDAKMWRVVYNMSLSSEKRSFDDVANGQHHSP